MPRAGSMMRRRDIDSGHSRDIFILSSWIGADDIADRWLNVRLTVTQQQQQRRWFPQRLTAVTFVSASNSIRPHKPATWDAFRQRPISLGVSIPLERSYGNKNTILSLILTSNRILANRNILYIAYKLQSPIMNTIFTIPAIFRHQNYRNELVRYDVI